MAFTVAAMLGFPLFVSAMFERGIQFFSILGCLVFIGVLVVWQEHVKEKASWYSNAETAVADVLHIRSVQSRYSSSLIIEAGVEREGAVITGDIPAEHYREEDYLHANKIKVLISKTRPYTLQSIVVPSYLEPVEESA
jgi:hypothetical protein